VSGLQARLRLARERFALDVELTVAEGGVTALFGPSGSGKTTALRCIAGLERAPGSFVAFDGACWQDEANGTFVPAHQRGCGYVFQDASLFPHLSVSRNLEYGWKRVPAGAQRMAIERTVELLGLAALLPRMPRDLSGGERQRVALGRALLASPRLLLMDEPLASLDAARKGEILYYIERVRDALGVPMIYVSHSVEEVVRLADRVVRIADGKVIEAGPVVGRLADGAVIDTVVAEHDLQWELTRLEFRAGSLYAADVDALVGERVRVRVRAQEVSLALSRPAGLSIRNIIAGTIVALGTEAGPSLDVELDLGGTPLIARITRKSATELGLRPGLPVFALIKSVSIDRRSVGYA
jgi:molybdate transport system ATP-binding protein